MDGVDDEIPNILESQSNEYDFVIETIRNSK
jgi:hypothetical protein